MSGNQSNITEKTIEIVVICPHCNNHVLIEQLNCKIFRHGIFKCNNIQINPHSTKEECEYYIKNDLIYGCGKPFIIIENNNELKTEICEFI
jgi:hypothetical protein